MSWLGDVEAAIDGALCAGEVGLQVAVYGGEELMVDVSAGFADRHRQIPVTAGTLFNVFSATKAVAALAVHIQADRGQLEYDAPVARYWPEFAQHGKGTVTVRDVLTHAAGIPQLPAELTAAEMCDWDHMAEAIAALEPLWPPGSRYGYHAYTFGWITGELVRRTDPKDRTFRQFVIDEVASPLSIEDLWLGIPPTTRSRVAEIIDLDAPSGSAPVIPADSLLARAIPPTLSTNMATFGRADVQESCHPGAGGVMNARSLARLYAMLANGGALNGVRLVSRARVATMSELQSDETDAVMGRAYRRGLGFWLGGSPGSNGALIGSSPSAFGHPGAGGSIGWCDPRSTLSCAIVKNRMFAPATPEDNPILPIAEAIRKSDNVRL